MVVEVRPRVVCLSGSTRFKEEFLQAEVEETMAGHIVLSVEVFGHADNIILSDEDKQRLDELHLRKIDLADELLVVSVDYYVGESTRREIRYAVDHGKPVRWWEDER